MAGNDQESLNGKEMKPEGAPEGSSHQNLAAKKSPVQVKVFNCPKCGSNLTLRGMSQTVVVACRSCGSVIDIQDEDYRILGGFKKKEIVKTYIPFGIKGHLDGEVFETIGFMQRRDEYNDIWGEYLLFNPYKGFRWLLEYKGHWTYLKMVKDIGDILPGCHELTYQDTVYKLFAQGTAEVIYVIGEFYWQVKVGEKTKTMDYICPPRILSLEVTYYNAGKELKISADTEKIWSFGSYMEPEEVQRAFSLTDPLPQKIGIAMNQPWKYSLISADIFKWAILFLISIILIHLYFVGVSQKREVFNQEYSYVSSDSEKEEVTPTFELTGRISNLAIRSTTNVLNKWIYLNMALINVQTGKVHLIGREIAYYAGYDWTEGSQIDEVVLSSVPSGTYYLTIKPEADKTLTNQNYRISLTRDVPQWTFFWIAIFLVIIGPILLFWRKKEFESQRWEESDVLQEENSLLK